MLALFGAVLLTVVGVGWYLGWYKVNSQPASVPGQHSVKIDINTDKIGDDLKKGEAKFQTLLENKAHDDAKKADGNLMMPSPLPGPQLNAETGNDKGTPLFQFHTGKGSTLEIGNGDKGPLFQFDTGNKGPVIQFGGSSEKK
jgi:hypothetical protein